MLSKTHCGVLVLAVLSALGVAQARQAAPQFTASALDGETFTNASLLGKVTLVQFWATWCPYCRREQPLVDNIVRDLGDGLVVLAVDVGEPAPTVKTYLDEHPRSCHIVLTEATNLVAAYSPTSLPLYVVIDRDGNIAGVQHGAAGEQALRAMLTQAGVGGSAAVATPSGDQRPGASKAAGSGSATLIEVQGGSSAPPSKPLPPTVFVLKGGERLEARHYTIMGGLVHITEAGKRRSVPLTDLDLKTTVALNHDRGIELKIPTNPNQIVLGM